MPGPWTGWERERGWCTDFSDTGPVRTELTSLQGVQTWGRVDTPLHPQSVPLLQGHADCTRLGGAWEKTSPRKYQTWDLVRVETWALMDQRVCAVGGGEGGNWQTALAKHWSKARAVEFRELEVTLAGLESGIEGQEMLWWALRLGRNSGCTFQRAMSLG